MVFGICTEFIAGFGIDGVEKSVGGELGGGGIWRDSSIGAGHEAGHCEHDQEVVGGSRLFWSVRIGDDLVHVLLLVRGQIWVALI
jgi:hypothetical protein